MKRESVGWILIATTFLGIVAGLTTVQPVKRDNCIPQGYGRTPVDFRLRTPNELL